MANTPMFFGFAPLTVQGRAPVATDYHRYVIRAADINAYRRGDAVQSTNDADAFGVAAVTVATGTAPVRGVIGSVEPGAPNAPYKNSGELWAVPANKQSTDYYVWVLDDPTAVFLVQDDGLTPANLVSSSMSKQAAFTPNSAAVTPSKSSATVLASGTIGVGAVVEILGLGANSAYGPYATWRVAFEQHELASSGLPFSPAEQAGLKGLVSGAVTAAAASRAITASDNAASLAPSAALTLTIPAGLSPMPSFTVDCPAGGTISIAVSGGATINGAATTLTRTRAANPVGFVVLAHLETDSYGISGA